MLKVPLPPGRRGLKRPMGWRGAPAAKSSLNLERPSNPRDPHACRCPRRYFCHFQLIRATATHGRRSRTARSARRRCPPYSTSPPSVARSRRRTASRCRTTVQEMPNGNSKTYIVHVVWSVNHRHFASKQRATRPLPRSGAFRKNGLLLKRPWSAFPWSWRPPRSSTGKTKVVGLLELSMPAPLHHAHHDGITSYHLALCDPPTGGPTYCRPLSGCRLPERARAPVV